MNAPGDADHPQSGIKLVAVGSEPLLQLIGKSLSGEDLEIFACRDAEEGWRQLQRVRAPVVIWELEGERPSLDLLERIVAWDPAVNVVLIGDSSTDAAVEAIQRGASDYLTRPLLSDTLRSRVERLLDEARQRRRALALEEKLLEAYRFENLVGRSPLMLEVFARIRRVAPHYQTALITGATGTGKELVAQALHRMSPAAPERLVVSNCSAIVETLFESELFGHVKGAFTGAAQDRVGLFEYARGGTVLLDEIGDMPLATQSKLLRVLQNQEIQRVGSSAVHKVNVRVIAATNRDLRSLIEAKLFREDLFYRLSMVEIRLPTLLERREDVPLLVRHFVQRFAAQFHKRIAGVTRRAQALLVRHSWPGNVRELENVIGHAAMMAEREFIDIGDLPEFLRRPARTPQPGDADLIPLMEVERQYVLQVLERMGGNKLRAAEVLGISRATLYRMLREMAGAKEAPVEAMA